MANITAKELEGLTLDQQCHLYATIAWNGKNFEEAMQIVSGKTNEELENITWAGNSIKSAQEGILEKRQELKTDDKYSAVIKILIKIHDQWVKDNAKKYDRDAKNENPAKVDKRLYQHLPTALIGLEELAKDMMFLQPYLSAVGIEIGEMSKDEYGSFTPAKEVAEAYNQYVKNFKKYYDIEELTAEKIKKVIEDYEPLKAEDEKSKERLDYMVKRSNLLASQAKEKNPEIFNEKEMEM